MDFIEKCRATIGFDTSPGQSNKSLTDWLQQQAQSYGLFVETQTSFLEDTEQANIIIRTQEKRSETEFLLQTHLDTVNPGPFQMWHKNEFNPFDATIVDGSIHGLGAADAKLDFICKLEALATFKGKANWKLAPVLVGTFGEQAGMAGAMKLIRKNLVSPKFALVGEPTDLKLVYAAKGFAKVEIRIPFSAEEIQYRHEHNFKESTSTQSKIFMGKAAHSGNPESGDSAIIKMMDYLCQMPDNVATMEVDGGTNYNSIPSNALLELDVHSIQDPIAVKIKKVYRMIQKLEEDFRKFQDHEFTPPPPTLNIGLIRTYEDHVLLMGNCRIPPMITQSVYLDWMDHLKRECEIIGAQFQVSDYKRPFKTSEQSIFLKGGLDILRTMGLSDKAVTQPSTNESSLFARLGTECLCFGPGVREGNMHTPTEGVKIEDLKTAIEFYTRMIERFST